MLADAQNKEYTKKKINSLAICALDDLAKAYKIIAQNRKIPDNEDETNQSLLTSLKNQQGKLAVNISGDTC